jgi:sodium-dependent phosphate transporter
MGVSMAKLSPSRGFSAELSTALVILVASQLGLPTSSSQCITGGIVGVGLLEGIRGGVNWKLFAQQFASWVATLFVVGLGVAAVFAQGIYSPSKIDGDQVGCCHRYVVVWGLSRRCGLLARQLLA